MTDIPSEDTFVDLSAKSDQELKSLLDELCREEEKVSYRRRIIHGKIDILRGEIVNRLKEKRSRGEKLFTRDDINKLGEILAREQTACSDTDKEH